MSTARQQSYAKSWEGFTQGAKMNRLKVKTLLDIDKAAAERMNFLFFDGHDLWPMCTLSWPPSSFSDRTSRLGGLPRATAALKGFTKPEPPKGCIPIPFPVFALILRQIWNSHRLIALWLVMTWATCARPGEAHRLTCQDFYVVILNSGVGVVSQTTANQNLEEPEVKRPRPTSRWAKLDEAVLLDQPYLLGAGELLHSLAKKGKTPVQLQPQRWHEGAQPDLARLGFGSPWNKLCVSGPARLCFHRCPHQVSKLGRFPEKRTAAQPKERHKVFQWRPNQPGLQLLGRTPKNGCFVRRAVFQGL